MVVNFRGKDINAGGFRVNNAKITATPDEINQVCDGVGPTATASNITALADVKDDLLAAASGGGSGVGVSVWGIALPADVTTSFSFDPLVSAHVEEIFRSGLALNVAKTAYVLDRSGRWLALGNVRIAQHATAWLGVWVNAPADGEMPVVAIPPISVIDMTTYAGGVTVDFAGLIERDAGAEVGYGVHVSGGDTTLADSYLKITYVGPKTGIV